MLSNGTSEVMHPYHTLPRGQSQSGKSAASVVEERALRAARHQHDRAWGPRHRHRGATRLARLRKRSRGLAQPALAHAGRSYLAPGCSLDPPVGGGRSVRAMNSRTDTTDPGWAPLAVLMGGIFLVVLDFFIVNVALPSMQRDLHASDSGLEWVVAGYGLTFSALLIAVTRLGDRWGSRRMFSWGTALFVVADAACGAAPTMELLVGARLAQGVAGAMVSTMVLALIGDVYAGPRMPRAIGVYSMGMGLAAATGQLIGGVL